MTTPAQPHIQARKTPKGFNLQLDNASWSELMTALSVAIKACDETDDPAWATRFRALRTALSMAAPETK